jgi:hypothetical protein
MKSHERVSFFLAVGRWTWLGAGRWALGVLCAALVLQAAPAAQQPAPGKGTLERFTVHGRALEGNLEGDSPDRPIAWCADGRSDTCANMTSRSATRDKTATFPGADWRISLNAESRRWAKSGGSLTSRTVPSPSRIVEGTGGRRRISANTSHNRSMHAVAV